MTGVPICFLVVFWGGAGLVTVGQTFVLGGQGTQAACTNRAGIRATVTTRSTVMMRGAWGCGGPRDGAGTTHGRAWSGFSCWRVLWREKLL